MLASQPLSLGIDENRIDDLAQNVVVAQQIDGADALADALAPPLQETEPNIATERR